MQYLKEAYFVRVVYMPPAFWIVEWVVYVKCALSFHALVISSYYHTARMVSQEFSQPFPRKILENYRSSIRSEGRKMKSSRERGARSLTKLRYFSECDKIVINSI